MRRHRGRITIAALLLAVGASIVLLLPTPRCMLLGWVRGEHFWQGRPASWWVSEIDRIEEAHLLREVPIRDPVTARLEDLLGVKLRDRAVWEKLVAGNDPETVPILIAFLKANCCKGLVERDPGQAEAVADLNIRIRERICGILERCGPNAAPALPELKELAENDTNERVRNAAQRALAAINGAVQ